MDIDWTIVNRAKRLAKDQLEQPILKFPIVSDSRKPICDFLKPGMRVLEVGAHQRELKGYLERSVGWSLDYKSMDIDRTFEHDFYTLEEIAGKYEAIVCYEVVEHMSPGMVLTLFRKAYELLVPGGRLFVSTPNVHHPIAFWGDSTHITPFRLRHVAGWMGTAGFKRFWGYRIVQMTWKKRIRICRYRGLLRLLNLDFAPGILVIGEKTE